MQAFNEGHPLLEGSREELHNVLQLLTQSRGFRPEGLVFRLERLTPFS